MLVMIFFTFICYKPSELESGVYHSNGVFKTRNNLVAFSPHPNTFVFVFSCCVTLQLLSRDSQYFQGYFLNSVNSKH